MAPHVISGGAVPVVQMTAAAWSQSLSRDYTIGATIHSSTNCTLIKARDKRNSELVLIKSYKSKASEMAASEAAFMQQFQPNINVCTVKQVIITDGGTHLILEFLPKHLKGLIESYKDNVPDELTRFIGMQILRALDYMHQRDVVYLGLRSDHVLLKTGEGLPVLVKLIHFKRSIKIELDPRKQLNERNVAKYNTPEALHTCIFDAPEVLVGDEASSAADIWSFGCVLAEMVTGAPLFQGSSPSEVLSFVLQNVGRPTERLQQMISQKLQFKFILGEAEDWPDDPLDSNLAIQLVDVLPHDKAMVGLILSCLSIDPARRPSTAQLLNHAHFLPDQNAGDFGMGVRSAYLNRSESMSGIANIGIRKQSRQPSMTSDGLASRSAMNSRAGAGFGDLGSRAASGVLNDESSDLGLGITGSRR